MRTKSFLLALTLCLLCLVSSASAVLPEVTERGIITALDAENGTMTILPDARYACNYSATPSCRWEAMNESVEIGGTVPDSEVFSVFEVGDTVALTAMGVHGVSGGVGGGRWITVGKLVASEGTWYATEIVGDPGALPISLVGDYAVTYEAVQDCANWTGSVCPATAMNVTILSEGVTVFEDLVEPGEELMYNGRNDNSSISVTFLRGEASSFGCTDLPVVPPGPQPVSAFLVHVDPPIGFEAENISTPTTVPITTAVPSSSNALLVSLAAGLLGCATVFRRR